MLSSTRLPWQRCTTRHICHFVRSYASQSVAEELRAARSYCAQSLAKYDSPAFTLLAFVPGPAQSAYLAIRALNVEISRIPDTVSNPMIGSIRYQFWRDNIDRLYTASTPPKHPIMILLSYALEDLHLRSPVTETLSKSWFMRIINARQEYGAGDRPFASLDALQRYAENTYSSLLYLTLQALPVTSITTDHVASHIGKAAGISSLLSGLPLLAFPSAPNTHNSMRAGLAPPTEPATLPRSIVAIPMDIMASCGVAEEDVFRNGSQATGLRDAVFTVATRASDHLITARTMMKNVYAGEGVGHDFEEDLSDHQHAIDMYEQLDASDTKKGRQKGELLRAFPVLLTALSTQLWLDKLQKYDFDIFRPELRRRDWKLPFKAFLANRRKMI